MIKRSSIKIVLTVLTNGKIIKTQNFAVLTAAFVFVFRAKRKWKGKNNTTLIRKQKMMV